MVARRKYLQQNRHKRSWKINDEMSMFVRFLIGKNLELQGHSKVMLLKLGDETKVTEISQ